MDSNSPRKEDVCATKSDEIDGEMQPKRTGDVNSASADDQPNPTSTRPRSPPELPAPPEKRPRMCSYSPVRATHTPSSSATGSESAGSSRSRAARHLNVPSMAVPQALKPPEPQIPSSSSSASTTGSCLFSRPDSRRSVSPHVRRTGQFEGVELLREGAAPAGWPGFGSEEEMGMSSSGAEEDERNNKYLGFEWQWDDNAKSGACCLAKMKTEVRFHLDYSCGTAAARGSEVMSDGQYYWEVKMVSPVYGTDMMVGVGTKQVDLNQYSRAFCSMLGNEAGGESCGLSYTGRFQKGGVGRMYCSKFGQGAIIGMHLDMWFGTLTYYKNGKCLGTATRNLLGKTWYPLVSSTAARSSMRLVKTKSFPSNLQFWCCQALRKAVPPDLNVLEVLELPPGLKNFLEDNLSWLVTAPESKVEVDCKTTGTQTVLSMMSKPHWKPRTSSS